MKFKHTCANSLTSPVATEDDPGIDYIWVFISFYISKGIREPKKSNLLFPSVGQFFYDALEYKHYPKITFFGLILK